MVKKVDAVVIGVGGIGSSTLLHLAEKGLSCLGIEQFTIGHSRGSSHGETRAIRKAYFEHPSYVPLLHAAYDGWERIEGRCNEELKGSLGSNQLFFKTGLLEVGPPDGVLVSGVRKSVAEHDLLLEEYEGAEFSARFPGFALPNGSVALYEPDGGFLLVEHCVQACAALAQKSGAEVWENVEVHSWENLGGHFEIVTASEKVLAEHLVVTGGAWTGSLVAELGPRLQVTRKHLHWFKVEDSNFDLASSAPVFFYQTESGFFYGFPSLDGHKMKIAEHSGGEPIASAGVLSEEVDETDLARVRSFIPGHLHGVNSDPVDHQVCIYTLSPDEHFIVDTHPEQGKLAFAAGLSGHGFKFASVLGQRVADLVVDGKRDPAMDFLRLARLS